MSMSAVRTAFAVFSPPFTIAANSSSSAALEISYTPDPLGVRANIGIAANAINPKNVNFLFIMFFGFTG